MSALVAFHYIVGRCYFTLLLGEPKWAVRSWCQGEEVYIKPEFDCLSDRVEEGGKAKGFIQKCGLGAKTRFKRPLTQNAFSVSQKPTQFVANVTNPGQVTLSLSQKVKRLVELSSVRSG